MVVSDDDGPDFVDELEAELAARRPVPVQQEPERESNYESPTDPMWALIAADRKASKRRRENGHAPGYGSCFRGAVTHTGADFLSALNDLGWTIAPAAGPSVGLRDRVRDAILAELHGRPFLTRASATKAADRVLSVLHEAGEQGDGLDALARQFKNGQTVVWGDGPTQQGAVVGFGYTIPEHPGGPDRPALVVRERWGERTGHVLPSELTPSPAVAGEQDFASDGEGSRADAKGCPPARQTAAGSQLPFSLLNDAANELHVAEAVCNQVGDYSQARASAAVCAEIRAFLAGDGDVVVSRTDLEWAVGMIGGMLLHPDHDPIYARLRAVLNTENQT